MSSFPWQCSDSGFEIAQIFSEQRKSWLEHSFPNGYSLNIQVRRPNYHGKSQRKAVQGSNAHKVLRRAEGYDFLLTLTD